MKNLAGVAECDTDIMRELARSGIDAVTVERTSTEVPYSITGKLGGITFTRGWYYWIVKCHLPLAVAQELYADPVGKTDIRVAGHCGCPPPEEWAQYVDKDGLILINNTERLENEELNRDIEKRGYRFVEDPSAEGQAVIASYHIDTEVGLRLFADIVKRHELG